MLVLGPCDMADTLQLPHFHKEMHMVIAVYHNECATFELTLDLCGGSVQVGCPLGRQLRRCLLFRTWTWESSSLELKVSDGTEVT